MNIATFLRAAFLWNTSGGSFCAKGFTSKLYNHKDVIAANEANKSKKNNSIKKIGK